MGNKPESPLPKNYTFKSSRTQGFTHAGCESFRLTLKCDLQFQTSGSIVLDLELTRESNEYPWNEIGRLNYLGVYEVISGTGDEKRIKINLTKKKSYKERGEGDFKDSPWVVKVEENTESETQVHAVVKVNISNGYFSFYNEKEIFVGPISNVSIFTPEWKTEFEKTLIS